MKTLFLSSNSGFIIEHASEFLPKSLGQMKIAYITTASKGVEDKEYIKIHKQQMMDRGYDYEELDLDGKTENELRNILKDKDAVYVEGGNTFYLLKAARESGFDKLIKELVSNGVIYLGSSAGSYIACPTIEMATWKPKSRDRFGVTDFTAFGLVPFLITAHYKPELKELLLERIKESKYPVRILADEQALLVWDDEIKFVGKGEEIKL